MGSLSLVFLLSLFLISLNLTAAQTRCGTGNFTTNSTYAKNRNLIPSSLPSNAAINGGFYNATIGQGSDRVYALALCRGDLSSETCHDCVNSSSLDLINSCPNQTEGIIWGGNGPQCIVRYSNRAIFGVMEVSPSHVAYNVANVTTNLDEFDKAWNDLMLKILTSAAMGSSSLKFGAAETNLTYFETLYAFVQCTPDLSQSDCRECLRGAVSDFQSCCHGKQGGVVLKPSCFMRNDLYRIYNSTAVALLSPPPPSPVAYYSPPPMSMTPRKGKDSNTARTVILIVVPTITSLILIVCICIFLRVRKARKKVETVGAVEAVDEITTVESLQFDFGTIRVATDNFSDANKLGQGGFGAVYKGRLSNGQDIAVKRLSLGSGQGDQEFKTEVLLVAKLQHRNLVRLLGFCLEVNERLLVYEFVPNKSLDHFIFDPIKRARLDWERRYKIIGGIARGLLYLHEDSRLRIIHRDLKASNILLDAEMNPKISDFGLARLFVMDQTQGNTSRIMGTYGYMAPEYAMHGQFSVKSDVFSFGVLLLEIVSGQKNNSFRNGENVEDLISYAWKNWREGTASNVMDPLLRSGSRNEIMRCIHVGLLCVQENVADRPTMASVVVMLSSYSLTLPVPSEPAFFMHSRSMESEMPLMLEHYSGATESDQSQNKSAQFSVNEASITDLYPR